MGKAREKELVVWFEDIRKEDISLVGGKNANLGEMISFNLPVPPGFALTAYAYKRFVEETEIQNKIMSLLSDIDVNNSDQLNSVTEEIRELMISAPMPKDIEAAVKKAYAELNKKTKMRDMLVAVRSSATAEDLPGASFAGQQETYLNVSGEKDVLENVKKCWASLYTPRATFYRIEKGFAHENVFLSVAVQKMVNAKCAGVMFTLNPATGDESQIMIEGNWGLGEAVVSGAVTPDDFVIDKATLKIIEKNLAKKTVEYTKDTSGKNIKAPVSPERQNVSCLSDEEIIKLAELGKVIEKHYGRGMDIEWSVDKDFRFPESVFIVQARPETVWDQKGKGEKHAESAAPSAGPKKVVCKGMAASPGCVVCVARIVLDAKDINRVQQGDLLVTKMTTPDWVPAMRKAKAIVTDEGGATCHAAIVSRELGIPCIVGTKNATSAMHDGMTYTVDAKTGVVYEGATMEAKPAAAPAAASSGTSGYVSTGTKIFMNLGIPEKIDDYGKLPFDGIGLMRLEFIIATYINAHPNAMIKAGKSQEYIDKLAEGISKVAEAIEPRPVIVRMSDFKTNEYKDLPGGAEYEPHEDNAMIGWRGVSRYISPGFEEAFRLECRAMKKVREEFDSKNVWMMLPFVRTTWEVEKALKIIEEEGLKRSNDFKLFAMAEVPSIVFQVEEFCKYFDGFSIGSNDLTQLIVGSDRDSELLANAGYLDERNPAVMRAIKHLIDGAHKHGKTVGICGQAPSNYPEFTEFLVECGIDEVSVNPDVVERTRQVVASAEKKIMLTRLKKLVDTRGE